MQRTYGMPTLAKPIYKIKETDERKAIGKEEAGGMVESGIPRDKTIKYLMEAGYSRDAAADIVTTMEKRMAKVKETKARKRIFSGVLCVVIGAMLAWLSYAVVSNEVGYLPAALSVLFGGVQVFKGLKANLK